MRPFNAAFSEITAQMENNPLNEHESGDLVLVVVKGYRITIRKRLEASPLRPSPIHYSAKKFHVICITYLTVHRKNVLLQFIIKENSSGIV